MRNMQQPYAGSCSIIHITRHKTMKYRCKVCGAIIESDGIPEVCPVCRVKGDDKFELIEEGKEKVYADEHRIGVAKGLDAEVVQGLRDHFNGECCEVGMYLAMSRQAEREGYPEVADAFKRYALEEAEHAAKFAELLGEVVHPDTRKNLELRAEHAPANWPLRRGPKNWATTRSTTLCTKCAKMRHVMAKDLTVC